MGEPGRAPEAFVGDRLVFSRGWQTGIRALTLVACGYTLTACVLADWEHAFGEDHVFSRVRPAVRSFLNDVFGGGGAAAGTGGGGGGGGSGECSSGGACARAGGAPLPGAAGARR
jgi:hypothetical protein